MTDKVILSHIKSEPLEDEQGSSDVSICRKGPEEYVEELEKQLANNLTIQEAPTVSSVEVLSSTKNVPSTAKHTDVDANLQKVANLSSKLKNSEACNEELRKSLAALKAELTTMKGKYWTEKLTLESITKAKWKSAEQVKKEDHERDIAALKTNLKNTEKTLTQKNDSLISDVGRLETDLKQTLTTLVQLEKDLGAARSSVRMLTDKLIQAETALEETVQAKESLQKLCANLKNQCADLLRQVEVFKCNEQSNMQQLCSLEDKAEQMSLLSLELPALRSQHDVTKNKLINAEAKILQLESEIMDHKKKALGLNIIKRKLQQAQDNQKNTDSAMAILVQKLATLEHAKEDAEGLKSALNQLHEERITSRNKIKRLKRRLLRQTDSNILLMTKWDKLTLFLRKLEEKAATGELLTRSDFDTVLHFVLSSPFTDVKRELDDSSYGRTDEIDKDVAEIELSPSPVKDTIEKVVKKFKAVQITAKRLPSTSKSPTKSTVGCRHNEKVCSRKTTNIRTTCSNITCSTASCLKSDLRKRRSRSISPVRWYSRKRSSMTSTRRSNSRSLSVETISRSPSPSKDYKRCRYRRSRSRSYTRYAKSYSRYSPFYYSSRSSSREPPSRRSVSKKNSKESDCNRKSSVEKRKEVHSSKQLISKLNDKCDFVASKSSQQLDASKLRPSEMEKVAETDRKGGDSSPEITIVDVAENRQETSASPLEEGEIEEKYLLSPVPEAATITEAEWDALILSPKDNLSPTLAMVSLQPSRDAQNLTNPEDNEINPDVPSDRLDSLLTQEIQNLHSSEDYYEVARPSSSVIDTMTHCTSDPGTSRHSPDIVPLCVVPAANVHECKTPGQSFKRPPLLPTPSPDFVPLLPPPSPPPFLALELTNVPVIISSNRGKNKPVGKVMCNVYDIGIAEGMYHTSNNKNRCRSNYSQQVPFLYSPTTEDWDAESNDYEFNGGNRAPSSATWNKHSSRGNYNKINNMRIVVPPSRTCRPKNKRKFAPYMRENRPTNIPIELNIRGNIPQQPLPGHSIVDEFMQQYTVSIIKEIPGFSEKHPIEALKDLCISKGWEAPKYSYHADTMKNPRTLEYFCKVFVNNVLHQPKYGSSVKTDAQTIAAIYCLQQLGVNP